MRAAGIEQQGAGLVGLRLAEPRLPDPDEALVAVRAAGVGNWDELVRTGGWDLGRRPPLALGVEGAGQVIAVGDAVSNLAVGDEVLWHTAPLRDQGSWAERQIVPVAAVAKKPPRLRWDVAATMPVPALTAHQALHEALGVAPGETLLVHGAGGVTGGLVAQLAVAAGLQVAATAGPANLARVRSYGVALVVDHHDPDWPAEVRRVTGGAGVDAAVNAARGEAAIALTAVADGGRLVTITGDPPRPDRRIEVGDVYVHPDGAQLAQLADLVARGGIEIRIARSYPLEDAGRALQLVASGAAGGAVALEVNAAVHDHILPE